MFTAELDLDIVLGCPFEYLLETWILCCIQAFSFQMNLYVYALETSLGEVLPSGYQFYCPNRKYKHLNCITVVYVEISEDSLEESVLMCPRDQI